MLNASLAMESTTVRQSYKHPTLCTVTVDGYGSQPEGPGPVPRPEHHWRLPNTDPRNEGKYMFRLHTLDIYFWKIEDAHAFLAAAKNKLEPEQIAILDAPPNKTSHEHLMSPVVQQLENVAVQDPAYRNGQTRNSRTTSTSVTSPHTDSVSEDAGRQETPKAPTPASFKPLAYNPAAPAAPEPIKHREKTPPPVDAEDGTGLAGAAYRDHAQSMSSQNSLLQFSHGQPQNIQGSITPQPSHSHISSVSSPNSSAGYVSSLSPAQGLRTSSIASIPPPPPQSGRGSVSPYTPTPSFAPPPPRTQSGASQHSQQVVPSFSAPPQDQSQSPFYKQDSNPLESPATEILGNSYVSGVRQPLQHLQPQYANYTPSSHGQEPERLGGYSNYQYDQQQPQHHHHHHQQPQSNEYDVHSQVYRPTPEEASKHKPLKVSTAAAGSPTGKLEQGAGKVDKKVNSLFKRLEKRIG
jgi:hypothetical protein